MRGYDIARAPNPAPQTSNLAKVTVAFKQVGLGPNLPAELEGLGSKPPAATAERRRRCSRLRIVHASARLWPPPRAWGRRADPRGQAHGRHSLGAEAQGDRGHGPRRR